MLPEKHSQAKIDKILKLTADRKQKEDS